MFDSEEFRKKLADKLKTGVNAKNFNEILGIGIAATDERTKKNIKELITDYIEKNIKVHERRDFFKKEWGLLKFTDISEIEAALEFVPKEFRFDVLELKTSTIINQDPRIEMTNALLVNILLINHIPFSSPTFKEGLNNIIKRMLASPQVKDFISGKPELFSKIITLSDHDTLSNIMSNSSLLPTFIHFWAYAEPSQFSNYKKAFDLLLPRIKGKELDYFTKVGDTGMAPLHLATPNIEILKLLLEPIAPSSDKKIASDTSPKEKSEALATALMAQNNANLSVLFFLMYHTSSGHGKPEDNFPLMLQYLKVLTPAQRFHALTQRSPMTSSTMLSGITAAMVNKNPELRKEASVFLDSVFDELTPEDRLKLLFQPHGVSVNPNEVFLEPLLVHTDLKDRDKWLSKVQKILVENTFKKDPTQALASSDIKDTEDLRTTREIETALQNKTFARFENVFLNIIKPDLNSIEPKDWELGQLFMEYVNELLSEFIYPFAARGVLVSDQEVKSYDEKERKRLIDSTEGAMDTSLVSRTKAHFDNKVVPYVNREFGKKFGSYTATERIAEIEQIENEIRLTILTRLSQDFKDDIKSLQDKTLKSKDGKDSKMLDEKQKGLELITSTIKLLSERTSKDPNQKQVDEAFKELRLLLISKTNDNQIAWRTYDKDAHYVGFFNFLALSPAQIEAGKKFDDDVKAGRRVDPMFVDYSGVYEDTSLLAASLRVREQAACYYLAAKKGTPEEQSERMTHFISQVSNIRRGHSTDSPVSNPNKVDSPTCFPGHFSAIAYMGDKNPAIKLPESAKSLINAMMKDIIVDLFRDEIKGLDYESKIKLLESLGNLTEHNAENFMEKTLDEEQLQLRHAFIEKLRTKMKENLPNIKKALKLNLGIEWKPEFNVYLKAVVNNPGGGDRFDRLLGLVPKFDSIKPPVVGLEHDKKITRELINPFNLKAVDEKSFIERNIRLMGETRARKKAFEAASKAWNLHHLFKGIAPILQKYKKSNEFDISTLTELTNKIADQKESFEKEKIIDPKKQEALLIDFLGSQPELKSHPNKKEIIKELINVYEKIPSYTSTLEPAATPKTTTPLTHGFDQFKTKADDESKPNHTGPSGPGF